MPHRVTFPQTDHVVVEKGLSFYEAAYILRVSPSSIKNWVKAGYLTLSSLNHITLDSFETFRQDMIGHEKLNKRANKQYASTHNHDELCEQILSQVWQNLDNSSIGDSLLDLYEKSLSDAHKNKEGIYYTPCFICNDLLQKVQITKQTTFCDPCCGGGNFLVAALQRGVKPENITGFDIDPVAVEIAKRRIFDRTGYRSEKIYVCDFLQDCPDTQFDIVITNPPWGKKYSAFEKKEMSQKWDLNSSLDSCALFTMAALERVKDGGTVGMLLPESFFKVKVFEEVRRIILDFKIQHLIDYDRAFEGLLSKAQAFLIKKQSACDNHIVECYSKTDHFHPQKIFSEMPFAIMNFKITPDEMDVIRLMMKTPHASFKQGCRWGLGIITGNNRYFISEQTTSRHTPIYKGSDIGKGTLKEASSFILKDLSGCQQIAPLELYYAPQKIIYRFISSKLMFFHDNKQRLILNSANMMIINEKIFGTYEKITSYLNLPLIDWFHEKVFDTHKILRSNLECIPLYTEYLSQNRVDDESLLHYLGVKRYNESYVCS